MARERVSNTKLREWIRASPPGQAALGRELLAARGVIRAARIVVAPVLRETTHGKYALLEARRKVLEAALAIYDEPATPGTKT